ncbi:hypothetical protein X726_31450 [Mesorhizobium sp. L103C105A0]|nr:hypothetical protein X726_31450 [Mesorhizobium sp. L103C105A0]
MRIGSDPGLWIGKSDSVEHVDGTSTLFASASSLVVLDIDHLVLDGSHGIERSHRILKDHGKSIAEQATARLSGHFEQVSSFE